MNTTDLSQYNNTHYHPGRNGLIQILWYFTNVFFLNNGLFPFSFLKVFLLKLYGAKIGKGVVVKPNVNIKYPWRLKIGNYVWIGENVWIDNLDDVEIGNNCCISQGALLLCGNHNYKNFTFDLITKKIILEEGVWIGAKSIVTSGVHCKSHIMLSVNSVLSEENTQAYTIYAGNPAKAIRKREIK